MRRPTRVVHLGGVLIGGDNPVSIQGMTNTHTTDVAATVAQINEMKQAGCEIVRVAVPRAPDALAISDIKAEIGELPLVADIHFDNNLAIKALEAGADGIRINPGNMRDMDAVADVVAAARSHDACIRIGVNSGSIRERTRAAAPEDETDDLADLMAGRTLEYLEHLDHLGFTNVKLSLKASDVPTTLRACRMVAESCDCPLHLGITSAGPPATSLVASSVGIGALLAVGIGDTIRVSMTGSPVDEIIAARKILEVLELRERTGPRIVSCPTCGRCDIDLVAIVEEVERRMPPDAPAIDVAIMGCIVNGPGEASDCDVGIAGGKGFAFLFRKGEKVGRLAEDEMVDVLLDEVMKFKR